MSLLECQEIIFYGRLDVIVFETKPFLCELLDVGHHLMRMLFSDAIVFIQDRLLVVRRAGVAAGYGSVLC